MKLLEDMIERCELGLHFALILIKIKIKEAILPIYISHVMFGTKNIEYTALDVEQKNDKT